MDEDLVVIQEDIEKEENKREVKPINHLYETAHQFNCGKCNGTGFIEVTETTNGTEISVTTNVICPECNGTGLEKETHNLVPREWNRFTVTDGDWMQKFTLTPIADRDLYLASIIEEYSGSRNKRYRAESGMYILPNNSLNFGFYETYTAQKPLEYYNDTLSLIYDKTDKTVGDAAIQFNLNDGYLEVSSTKGDNVFVFSAKKYSDGSTASQTAFNGKQGDTPEFNPTWNVWINTYKEHSGTISYEGGITEFPVQANVVIVTSQEETLSSKIDKDQKLEIEINGEKTTEHEPGFPISENIDEKWSNLWEPKTENTTAQQGITLQINTSEMIPDNVLFIY